jgi:predicted dehydrogenase
VTVRWGILGTGGIAEAFATALDRADGAALAGVASRDLARAGDFVTRHPGAAAFGSYEDLVSSTEVDVVYIATPQHRHADDALLALSHGKHVLVEKPLVLDEASAVAIAAEAERRSLVALEGMWTLFNPLVTRVLELVDSGQLGRLRSFSANTGPIGVPVGHRALRRELGGSLLWECLVYPVAVLAALEPAFAEPDTLHAVSLVRADGLDEASTVMLTAGTAVATFAGSFSPGSPEAASSRIQLLFDDAWVELAELYNPGSLRIGWTDGRLQEETTDADAVGFGYEIDAVGAAVSGRRPLPLRVTLPRTIANIRLLERIHSTAMRVD